MITSDQLAGILAEHLEAFNRLRAESQPLILQIAEMISGCLQRGGKILLCGNGGSAADAQHVAAEIVGRFTRERRGWPAIALTTDTSILTAVANDYGFDEVFARQVEALALPGDIVAGISTSGNSPNVLKALTKARMKGAATIAFTGAKGGLIDNPANLCFKAPSTVTARIQELHILVWHAVCDLVEAEMVANGSVDFSRR
ncbi:MAG: D-sedoheptulose 7-phosphate isomerase [Calditrichota bacterium]